MSDSKGDTVSYPKTVLSLPFSDQGNTYFFTDNYEIACGSENQTSSGGGKVSQTLSGHNLCAANGTLHASQAVIEFLPCIKAPRESTFLPAGIRYPAQEQSLHLCLKHTAQPLSHECSQ